MSPSSVKVKFVASDPARGGLPVKRKQVLQACASCRRKKPDQRKCKHVNSPVDAVDRTDGSKDLPESTELDAKSPEAHQINITTYEAGRVDDFNHDQPQNAPSATSPTSERIAPQPSRFVGDLNPEGMFMEATSAAGGPDTSQKADVGVWLSSTAGGSANGSQFITSRPPLIMDRFLLPFVKEHCLTYLPPEDDFLRLKAVFLNKVHPIFPIIPVDTLSSNTEDPCNVVLCQAVCIAAAADSDSLQHLHLRNRGAELLSPADFSQSLCSAVRAILETSIIADRVLHIRALTILSLYAQPTCSEEEDLPAQLGGRAIHHIQTLGLHLLRYDAPNIDDLETLFCATWALDRINSAIYARPCLFHERDIGTNMEACIRKRPPCFRLFLNVVQWLGQVVELYRPGPSAEASGLEKVAYMDLPVLEGMIVQADALNVPSHLIATIETFYHAVTILSCRLPRPGTATAASTLPPPSANARRSLAAERIACAVPRDCLTAINFVPYAVSLALSVEYRKMRHSRLPMFRARAMNAFRRNSELLSAYSEYFWSAKVIAGLSGRVLQEMERAASTLNRDVSPPKTNQTPRSASLNQAKKSTLTGMAATDTTMGMNNLVDFSIIDAVSGQDIFGYIDPSFNLDAVDDALEANLDIGLPLNWGDWDQFAA